MGDSNAHGDGTDKPSLPPLPDQTEIDAAIARASQESAKSKPINFEAVPVSETPQSRARKPVDLGLLTQSEIDRALSRISQAGAAENAEIESLLAAADSDPTNFAAAEAALRKLDQVESEASSDSANSADLLTEDELDTLLVPVEAEPADTEDEALVPGIDDEEAIKAPVVLGQEALDALLAAHPMVREEPPPSLPLPRNQQQDPEPAESMDEVGRENLAAAVPNPEAAVQPLSNDLVNSLVAEAAQAAAAGTERTKTAEDPLGVDVEKGTTNAVELSDADLADMGVPAVVAEDTEELHDEEPQTGDVGDSSPVVQRRLRRGGKFPAKILASLAASLLVGISALMMLWPDKKAEPHEQTAHEDDPSITLEDAIIFAKEHMGKGDYIAAMRQLSGAIRRAEPGPLLNEARFLHVEAGYRSLPPTPRDIDTETVLKNIEDVVALNPTYSRNPEALAWKAELYRRTGSPTLARDTYARIISNYPTAPNTDAILLEHARLSTEMNYLDDAAQSLERVVNEFPDSPHKSAAQMLLAKNLEAAGRNAEAEAIYAQVAAERTDSRLGADATLGLSRIAQQAGDLPRAVKALETRLETATTAEGNDAVYIELAKAYSATGKAVESVRTVRELLDFFPESPYVPEAVVELTRGLEATGDRRQALELANQAAERFNTDPNVARNRASMLSQAGDLRGAAQAMIKADSLGAKDPALVLNAGKNYIQLGEPKEAEGLFRRVVDEYPQTPQAAEASVEIAKLEYGRGELAPAIDRLAALANAPWAASHNVAIQSTLGSIYAELGLTRRATAAYEKIAAQTTDPELLARAATELLNNGAVGSALPVVRNIDQNRLSSRAGFELMMAQGRALLDVDAEQALEKMQTAFDSYPVERTPEDFEFLVRACLESGKTARARVLITDFRGYVDTHPDERERLQRTATLWGDALYKAGDYRAALDAYAIAAEMPPTATAEAPEVPNKESDWAVFQRANTMLKLEDYWSSVPILEQIAQSASPYAEDARIKADYARLEQRLRNQVETAAGG